jgi:hypothetical protein
MPEALTGAPALAARRLIAVALVLSACAGALSASQARASTSVAIHASFQPDRLGASTSLTARLRFAGASGETPAPVRSIVLRLPIGLGVELRGSSSCSPAILRRRGPGGCPQTALVGRGHAQLEVHAGSQTIPEQAVLWAFRGPPRGGAPTLEILGIGSTPLHEQTISTAVLRGDSAHGAQLTISIPAIPTLVFEPDASFASLTLTIGGLAAGAPARAAPVRILVPHRCPAGGFQFTGDFAFADRSVARAMTAVPCP